MTGPTERADQALVSRGLARSRAVARELIAAGRVTVEGRPVAKPATPVAPADLLTVAGEQDPWVGRAAYKLLGALETFPAIDPTGARALDVGASTGGFTQVLLAAGAAHVVALDVGTGQLAEPVRSDPRVTDLPGRNIRDTTVADLDGPFDLVVSDLSFISLTLVLARLAELTGPKGHLVTLVKPQFEVGRDRLARTGVVRSPNERARAVADVLDAVAATGLHVHGLAPSPIEGGTGNHEYLLWARHETDGKMAAAAIDRFVDTIREEPAP